VAVVLGSQQRTSPLAQIGTGGEVVLEQAADLRLAAQRDRPAGNLVAAALGEGGERAVDTLPVLGCYVLRDDCGCVSHETLSGSDI